jgi:hypothetical protein
MKRSLTASVLSLALMPICAAAQTTFNIRFPNPFRGGTTLYDFIRVVVTDIVLPIGGLISVIYIILAGFKFVTAQGDEKKIGEARQALLYGSIGAAIILGAWVIVQVIQTTIDSLSATP